ncbi:hypothetical protein Pint_14780 [Pistacia integerrima]|uniref:Uncharacterized protein n=1 Tax=Pistacia integerrima TaxID=434235 RepID=A0ACC0Z9H2_9ROSI|nr:hypothetical protein Pint_14780 [Pistacia integerrima]
MNSEENQMKTSTNEEDLHIHGQYAMQLVSASVLPMVLKTTIELGVLDIIDKAGPGVIMMVVKLIVSMVQDKVMLDMWHHLKEAVVERELPFNKPYGMSAVEYGVDYDLPSIIEKSTSYPGIEHVAGDMFIDIPKGEAIFMKVCR